MDTQDVAIVGSEVKYDLAVARDPNKVLAEATIAAKALKDVISKKAKPVMFNGEQYLEFEDWQTVAKFYGVTAKITSTEYVEIGGAKGFLARAEALLINNGMVISGAEAMCLNDEDKWTSRTKYEWKNGVKTKVGEVPVPMFQLRSMAQTRACAKCLRNILAWVVVLAGYKTTPAEEMDGVFGKTSEPPKPHTPPQRRSETAPTDGIKTATGFIIDQKAKNKGGFTEYAIEGFVKENGKPMFFSTRDPMISETLDEHRAKGEKVSLEYTENANPAFANSITGLVQVKEEVGDAQE
jgi:hypothetical protein